MNPNQESHFFQDTYRTGATRPPKSYGGLIAFLLVLVIFLCGVSTALGLMNIRLFRSLEEVAAQETNPVCFSNSRTGSGAEDVCFQLGFSGEEIPEFWCLYQELPRGIYITDVEDGSDAEAKGVLPGDILLQLDGTDISTADQLHNLLENRQSNSIAKVVLFREGQQLELTLSLLDN